MGYESREDRQAVTGPYFVQIIEVVFQVHGTGPVSFVKFRRQPEARMQGVAGFIKDCRVPADVHMAVFVTIGLWHGHAQAGRLKQKNLFE
jgi:hypothetical protein